MLAALYGFLGDFDLAEEAAQEAFTIAAERWPRDGTPPEPVGWLITTAKRRALDRLRRERVLARKAHLLTIDEATEDLMDDTDAAIPDERLELIFMCCHPALSTEAQVALTLRSFGGLSTEEIAQAFLVAPETMKRRLTRARRKIASAGIPFRIPAAQVLPARRAAVLAVVYLIYNEGYGGRADLSAEAIRLARILAELMPGEPEVLGLLALLLLQDARSAALFSGGELVRLADQDRSLWDAARIAEGRAVLDRVLALPGRGPYEVQAAIAARHADPDPDWTQIVSLYGELVALTGSPVAALNGAVALAEAGDPAEALRIVDGLDLDPYRYLHSTRAELLRRLGRAQEARAAYDRALALTGSGAERRFLTARRAEL